jgi:putative hemolysin
LPEFFYSSWVNPDYMYCTDDRGGKNGKQKQVKCILYSILKLPELNSNKDLAESGYQMGLAIELFTA